MKEINKYSFIVEYIVLLVLIYFVVFFKLGSFPFRLWDESMFAVNAYEMEKSGDYMTPYFDGHIDWRNSKPLLMTWIQCGFIKIVGFNEISMRLPSAIAVCISIITVFQFLRSKIDRMYAWIVALILLTSTGYIGLHTGRTGDADALFSLFILLTSLNVINWVIKKDEKYILFAFLFFSLAILSKGIASGLFVIPLVIGAICFIKFEFFKLFKSWYFYVGLAILILSWITVFPVREHFQNGYIDSVINNDLARFSEIKESHGYGWDFYLESIFYNRFTFYSVSFFLGLLLMFKNQDKIITVIGFFSVSLVLIYLIEISISQTKLYWYDMPIYPFLAILAGYPIYLFIERMTFEKRAGKVIVVVLVFFIPYRLMFFNSQSMKFNYGDSVAEATSIFLHTKYDRGDFTSVTVYNKEYQGSNLCYKNMFADRGVMVKITDQLNFQNSEQLFLSSENTETFSNLYSYDTLEVFQHGLLVKVK